MLCYQPASVLLPVSITGPWYSEKKIKLANTRRSELGFKQKQEDSELDYCCYRNLNPLTANTTASAIALTEAETASSVNHLAKNVTNVLSI